MKQLIKCNCEICGKEIFRNKSEYKRNISKKFYCSRECLKFFGYKKVSCNCSQCGKEILKKPADLNKSGNNFCSQSCAAKFNNAKRKKTREEKLEKTKKNNCSLCSKKIYKESKNCLDCHKKFSYGILKKTIAEHSYNKGSERYAKIRENARKIYKDSGQPCCCQKCGYSKHIEICHIKAIKDFPPETLISVVNDLSNLVCLCRNCHWELDHGMLDLSKIKDDFDPFPFCF